MNIQLEHVLIIVNILVSVYILRVFKERLKNQKTEIKNMKTIVSLIDLDKIKKYIKMQEESLEKEKQKFEYETNEYVKGNIGKALDIAIKPILNEMTSITDKYKTINSKLIKEIEEKDEIIKSLQ